MIVLSCLTTRSRLMMSLKLVVSKFLNFEMMSVMKSDSCLLFGANDSFDVWMTSLNRGITTEKGA